MSEKVALITGASRGIGKAIAEVLSEAGFKIAINYRSQDQLAKDLEAKLPGSKAYKADVSDEEECKNLVKQVKADMGRIDVLVNNAGLSIDQVITFAKPADFDKILSVNTKSVFLLTKLVSKVMIKQKQGSIINLTSVVGHTGNAGQCLYSASKGAITSFTKSIAKDLAGFGILANCVAPGFIATDMTDALPDEVKEQILSGIPLKRMGKPEEVAETVKFLASPAGSYITGTTIHVNGGML